MDLFVNLQGVGVDNPTNQPQTPSLTPEFFDGFHNPSIKKLQEEHFSHFPPGYRFIPTDEELLECYLRKKISNQPLPASRIVSANVYRHKPEFLSEVFKDYGETEWYFFTPRDRKYRNGTRPSRSADGGYWKATGADKSIKLHTEHIGFKKSLVFYRGKPPKGLKTNWIMHEYTVRDPPRNKRDANDMRLDDWVLCRIKKKAEKSNITSTEVADVDNENVILDDAENETLWNVDDAIVDPEPVIVDVGELQEPPPTIGVMQEVTYQFSNDLHSQYHETMVGPTEYPGALVDSAQMVQQVDSIPPLVDYTENDYGVEYLQHLDLSSIDVQLDYTFSDSSFTLPYS